MYHIAKVSIQLIYCDTIQSPNIDRGYNIPSHSGNVGSVCNDVNLTDR